MASIHLKAVTVGDGAASTGEDQSTWRPSPATNRSLWSAGSGSQHGQATTPFRPSPPWDLGVITCSQSGTVTTAAGIQQVVQSLAEYQAALAAWRYGPPVLLVVGTLGNLMTLWVLGTSSGISSSMAIYFRALAASDLTLLYTGLLRVWIKHVFDQEIRDAHSAVCKVQFFLMFVTGMTSAWFLVTMSAQRALLVAWPQRMRTLHSRRAASITVAVIVILSCVLNTHNLYGYDLLYYPDDEQYRCSYVNWDYKHFALTLWSWIDLSMSSILPFFSLVISNGMLMWKVASSVGDVKTLTTSAGQTAQDAVSQRQKMSTSLNLTLIFLSITFLLLTSPISVYVILDYYFQLLPFPMLDTDDAEHIAAATLGWALTSLSWYSNSAINFYLYCFTGSRFRAQVWQRICCEVSTQRGKTSSRQR